ncbi:hypothetical protein BZA02_10227 [Ruegeria sp. P4]|nr:hypothetical protein BZA02_10227 [Ruegeria sp. P4]
MKNLIKNNYGTYISATTGKKEGHCLRIVIFLLFSTTCAIFASSSIYSSYSVLVTSITILTGFTFTALFSDHTMADIGLPCPKNENDRTDLKRLGVLGENFKFRSSYFIALSIIGAVLMTAAALEINSPKFVSDTLSKLWPIFVSFLEFDPKDYLELIRYIVSTMTISAVVFIYLECLYTFYRMSETILAIVNLRRDYIRHSENSA